MSYAPMRRWLRTNITTTIATALLCTQTLSHLFVIAHELLQRKFHLCDLNKILCYINISTVQGFNKIMKARDMLNVMMRSVDEIEASIDIKYCIFVLLN
jgi:uncharacterized protein YjaG (DUF416 family)